MSPTRRRHGERDEFNAAPPSPQQNLPRTQNHEGLRQTQKVDEVSGHVPLSLGLVGRTSHRSHAPYRKCQITLRGPWQQVPPLRLSDISLMPCLAQTKAEQVPVWAISQKGDVLCRLGASPQNPAVRTRRGSASASA